MQGARWFFLPLIVHPPSALWGGKVLSLTREGPFLTHRGSGNNVLLISVSPICAAVERSNREADQIGCRSNVKSQHDYGVLKTLGAMGPLRQVKLHQNSLYPGDLSFLLGVG